MKRLRKRVEAEAEVDADVEVVMEVPAPTGLKRAKNGSAFTRCDECKKDVPVALISFHNCSLDAKIKMNLESLVVNGNADAKKKSTERKKTKLGEPKAKKEKKEKDPNAPKRPRTAFFIFLEDFRKTFSEANPDSKKGSIVAKEAGEKWKSMTEEEKKPYLDKAAELKAEFGKAVKSPDATDNQEQDSVDEDDEECKPKETEKDSAGEENIDEEGETDKKESAEVDDEEGKPHEEERID